MSWPLHSDLQLILLFQVQGAIMVSSMVEVVIGLMGLPGAAPVTLGLLQSPPLSPSLVSLSSKLLAS